MSYINKNSALPRLKCWRHSRTSNYSASTYPCRRTIRDLSTFHSLTPFPSLYKASPFIPSWDEASKSSIEQPSHLTLHSPALFFITQQKWAASNQLWPTRPRRPPPRPPSRMLKSPVNPLRRRKKLPMKRRMCLSSTSTSDVSALIRGMLPVFVGALRQLFCTHLVCLTSAFFFGSGDLFAIRTPTLLWLTFFQYHFQLSNLQ